MSAYNLSNYTYYGCRKYVNDNITVVFSTPATFVGERSNVHDYISLDDSLNSFNTDYIERASKKKDCIDQISDS